MVCVHHSLFNRSLVERRVYSFQFRAVINKAAMNVHV